MLTRFNFYELAKEDIALLQKRLSIYVGNFNFKVRSLNATTKLLVTDTCEQRLKPKYFGV